MTNEEIIIINRLLKKVRLKERGEITNVEKAPGELFDVVIDFDTEVRIVCTIEYLNKLLIEEVESN